MNVIRFLVVLPIVCVLSKKVYVGLDFKSTQLDARVCTTYKLDNKTYHFNRFQPDYGKNIHHMVIAACAEPDVPEKYWYCGAQPHIDAGYKLGSLCAGKDTLWMFSWSMRQDEEGLRLPKDYAYQLGKDTPYKYVLLEAHYHLPTINTSVFDSRAGFLVTYENKPLANTKLSAFNLKAVQDYKLPAKKKSYIDLLAKSPSTVQPIMYQIHFHGLGVKMSAYIIKQNTKNLKKPTWILLARQTPPTPQNYFPVLNNVTMEEGDLYAMRCTYNNYNDYEVNLGGADTDEMCVFQMTYAVGRDKNVSIGDIDTVRGSWKQMGLKNIPTDA